MSQYPRVIVTMAQNLLSVAADRHSQIHENKFYMLYNAILTYHFPLGLEYGIAPQSSITGTGTKPEYLVVKVARNQESIVLVVEVKKPAHDTPAGRATVKQELIDYIEERFDETLYPTIYGIGCIGLSWACYKMDRSGTGEPELVYDWTGNITTTQSYDMMEQLAGEIHAMTGTVRP